jgi:hypothetical protein
MVSDLETVTGGPELISDLHSPASVPASLGAALDEAAAKRAADVIRFRTCCADPRASK